MLFFAWWENVGKMVYIFYWFERVILMMDMLRFGIMVGCQFMLLY